MTYKKAIVTGGRGFIGYHLTQRLLRDGWVVHVVDNLSTGCNPEHEGATYSIKNVEDLEYMTHLVSSFQPDVVFHQAAIPRVAYSVQNPYPTTISNVLGTVSVLESIRLNTKDCRVILASSSSVYGGSDVLPTSERCACNPQSPYALQKWQDEQWAHIYSQLYDIDVCCLRYFNCFGSYSLFGGAYSTVLSGWLYSLFVDSSIHPFLEGDGTQTRDFCFVDNVVDANILAATSKNKFHGHVFNIAQGVSHSLLYVKDLLEEISGKKLELELRPPRQGDVKDTLANIDHAKHILKYDPKTDFDTQVKSMAHWYKESYPR